jgi:dTDP-4-amino-4,6-dideoxygalactose transaminase
MVALCALARECKLHVVEDCAHALGATLHGQPAGTFGTLACFSFYPTKQLAALGDAGTVTTADAGLAEHVRTLRSYGRREPGINSRMGELQAAFLRARLPRLGEELVRREALALRYDKGLAGTAVTPLPRHPGRGHALHLYVVEVSRRNAFRRELREAGIATGVHYAPVLSAQATWRRFVRTPVPLPIAERLAERVVSLPLFPALRDAEQATVIAAVQESRCATEQRSAGRFSRYDSRSNVV